MVGDNMDYFRDRAAAERISAGNANDPAVAAVHDELAARYEALVRASDRPVLYLAAEAMGCSA